MTALARELRYFIDESLLGLGKALAIARKDTVHPGHPLLPEIQLGALDIDWIPTVSKLGLVAVCRDRHIRSKPGEIQLLREHALRVFWIAGKKDLNNWDYLSRVVRRWSDIESFVDSRPSGPWFVAVNDGGLSELHIGA